MGVAISSQPAAAVVSGHPLSQLQQPRPGTSCSEEMDEFSEELQFDPTVSSGFFGGLGQGGFRSTPITYGVCPTPQPAAPTPQPTQQAVSQTAAPAKSDQQVEIRLIFYNILVSYYSLKVKGGGWCLQAHPTHGRRELT